METRVELKAKAKEQLKGNLGMLFVCTLIIGGITAGVNLIPFIGQVATFIFVPALSLGLVLVYLSVTNGNKVEIGMLFDGMSNFGTAFVLNLLISIFTTLWSLLLVVPGIIKGYSYSMAFYILAENPDMTATQALDESKRITEGHKMDLFVLQLSFIPWMLLTGITFGIAGIYVIPYITLTTTNFYHSIKNQA